MPSQRLSIPNADGDVLSARLDLPDRGQPLAYALFAHCFTCNKNYKAIGNISRALNSANIAVLRFDFTGLGESEGDFADTNFSSNVDDLVTVANFLTSDYDVSAPKLLIGHSLGGAAVLQAAGRIASTQAVVTINAPCDPAYIIRHLGDAPNRLETQDIVEISLAGRSFTIKRQFLDDLAEAQMKATIGAMDKPLLVFHALQDDTVDINNASHIFESARHPKSFIALDQADHLLSDAKVSRYVGELIAVWVKMYIDE